MLHKKVLKEAEEKITGLVLIRTVFHASFPVGSAIIEGL
jgi:hypothetical protein